MKCPHCSTQLKAEDSKAGEMYVCPQCKCRFRACLIKWEPKCYAKFHKEEDIGVE